MVVPAGCSGSIDYASLFRSEITPLGNCECDTCRQAAAKNCGLGDLESCVYYKFISVCVLGILYYTSGKNMET